MLTEEQTMDRNDLKRMVQEELKKDQPDPVRNARMRAVAETNGQFRFLVEGILGLIDGGLMSEVQGLQTIVHLVAATRDRLFYAQNLIESYMGCSEEGSIQEAWQQLVAGQYPEDIVQMTRLQYENILATDMNELRYEFLKKSSGSSADGADRSGGNETGSRNGYGFGNRRGT